MPADVFVYLDTNVIIDIYSAINEAWDPPDDLNHPSNRQRIAAARLRYYAYRRTPAGFSGPWFLVTSLDAEWELQKKPKGERVAGHFTTIDLASDAPSASQVAATATVLMAVTGITDVDDARHLAHAALRPEIVVLVTGDGTFRRRATRAQLAGKLIRSTIEAANLLALQPGERPPITPSFPMPPWLIPV